MAIVFKDWVFGAAFLATKGNLGGWFWVFSPESMYWCFSVVSPEAGLDHCLAGLAFFRPF